MSQNTSFASEV